MYTEFNLHNVLFYVLLPCDSVKRSRRRWKNAAAAETLQTFVSQILTGLRLWSLYLHTCVICLVPSKLLNIKVQSSSIHPSIHSVLAKDLFLYIQADPITSHNTAAHRSSLSCLISHFVFISISWQARMCVFVCMYVCLCTRSPSFV